MSEPRYWIWVFGEIEGLRWVLKHKRMAFPESAAPRATKAGPNDQAILYTSRGAFHNPTRDTSRLAGWVTVTGPVRRRPVEIFNREFALVCSIRPELILPERQGPEVKPLALRMERVKRPEVWGQYFRNNPIEVGRADFEVLRDAAEAWQP